MRNILFLIALITYLTVVMGFVGNRENMSHVMSCKISITDSTMNRFVRANDIRRLLESRKFLLSGVPSGKVDLEGIEHSLLSRQIISKAEAYITEPGILHVDVRQKTPFVRICNRLGQGYYLDRKGYIIPLALNFCPFVLVVNGYISEPFAVGRTMNIYDVKHDTLPRMQKTVYDAHRLATFIQGDKFWNAQIEQVYVNDKYEFELVPRVGSQIIELGNADNLREKFANLKLLYLEGFNKIGWNGYNRISLKYKNQVVCTKIN